VNNCKDTEPDDGKLLVEEWLPSSRRIILRACLNSGTTLDRGLFCIPVWAGYIDKDGTAWSRGGLCAEYLERIALSVGHKAMMQSLEKMPDRIMSDFDKWITSCINKGILMCVTDKKGEME
jgi:hypothetical protein